MSGAVTSEVVVPADHPSLAGHFPGQPVVPAVVLLDAVLAAVLAAVFAAVSKERRAHGNFVLRSIPSVKFLQPVLPDERVELRIHFADVEAAQVRASFEGMRAASLVFEGSFILSAGDS